MSSRLPVFRTVLAAAGAGLAVGLAAAAAAPFGPAIAPLAAGGLGFLAAIAVAALAVRGAGPAASAPGQPVRRRDPAVAFLAVLQREGRLVDFLREDLAAYSDAQVGAAVRSIHASCRKVLDEHLALEPVRSEDEGARVVIENGFDASAVRLTGNVSGKPPFRGVLRHRGWRTRRVELPADAAGQDPSIVAPAEVEIG